jgi:hypothetical protein
MSTTMPDTTGLDADRYLKEVAPYLGAVSAEERAELLEDLAEHLREIAAEPGPPLAERLGSPEAYAAELLASAGVTATGAPRQARLARVSSVIARVRASRIGREATRLGPVLRPAWWVARAYLVVALLASIEYGSYPGFPVPHLAGSSLVGLIAVVLVVPLSVRLGQRHLPRTGRLMAIGANIVLAIFALVLLGKVRSRQVIYVQPDGGVSQNATGGCLTNSSGENITNLYAYSPDGTLLDPVLLYDQDGQPINNLCPDFDDQGRPLTNQYSQDVNGAPVYNAFPRRQTVALQADSGSQPAPPGANVSVPPPAVVVPKLAPTTTVAPSTTTTATTAPPG